MLPVHDGTDRRDGPGGLVQKDRDKVLSQLFVPAVPGHERPGGLPHGLFLQDRRAGGLRRDPSHPLRLPPGDGDLHAGLLHLYGGLRRLLPRRGGGPCSGQGGPGLHPGGHPAAQPVRRLLYPLAVLRRPPSGIARRVPVLRPHRQLGGLSGGRGPAQDARVRPHEPRRGGRVSGGQGVPPAGARDGNLFAGPRRR